MTNAPHPRDQKPATAADRPLGIEARSRLDEIVERHRLPARADEQLERLLALIASDEHAPTAVRDPRRAVDQHLADSLVALEVKAVRDARVIADIGSGPGFPGLPLAIAKPGAELRLVESSTRACDFLERAVGDLGLRRAMVVNARAEDWPAGVGAHDLVVSRAVASLPVVLEYAAPLMRTDAVLVLWRGAPQAADLDAGSAAASILGLELIDQLRVRPFEAAQQRYLYLYSKVRDTPPRFPRRPGVAAKRPLSSVGTDARADPQRQPDP